MKRILMIANDIERWGPSRLPEPLSKAGIEVAALCSTDNPLSQSSFLTRLYDIDKLKSWRRFGRLLGRTMSDWKPDLVMPCDEQVVVMLHYFLKRPHIASLYLDAGQLSTLRRSIGHIDSLDAMVLKHQTRLLAESLGVPVPKSQFVASAAAAETAANSFGFPVYLKASFSWAGQGSILCTSASELREAFDSLHGNTSWAKSLTRRALGRDWYPSTSDIEVQQAITGEAVMYSAAALDGKLLGGLFASRVARMSAAGPSTTVAIGENPECHKIAEKMIAAMGASGFLAFDFMRCAKTGNMLLLECNPRPNQIFHLGHKVGLDLCQALADGLNGCSQAAVTASGDAIIPLFPQQWLQDELSTLTKIDALDVPANDAKLLNFMLRCVHERGKADCSLAGLLNRRGLVSTNYTFG